MKHEQRYHNFDGTNPKSSIEPKAITMTQKDPENGTKEEPTIGFEPMKDTAAAVPAFVEVSAPSDMPQGYQFSIDDAHGRTLVVAVPEGGVKQGDVFKAAVVGEPVGGGSHNIPTGRWRDGIFDFCAHGCCHPMFCLSFWVTPLALGQVLTRMKLNWTGTPISEETKTTAWSAFKVMFATFVVYQCLDTFIYFMTEGYIQPQYDAAQGIYVYPENIPMWANILDALRHCLSLAYGLLGLFLTIRARGHIRAKYNIPEQTCTGCEDFCCSLWCGCCSICQMARHTGKFTGILSFTLIFHLSQRVPSCSVFTFVPHS